MLEALWRHTGKAPGKLGLSVAVLCRQRIWGSLSMTQSFMGDKACWLEHMALDNSTGLDPEGVRLRASEVGQDKGLL